MNRLDQYILELEKLCEQEIPGAQGSVSSLFRAIWLEIVVIFRFACVLIGPLLLAYVPVGIAIGIYHIWKHIKKIDKSDKLHFKLYKYSDWSIGCKRLVFLEEKWKNMAEEDREFFVSSQIPLDINSETFFKLHEEYAKKYDENYIARTCAKRIIFVPTFLFYVLAIYPYYLMVGYWTLIAVIIVSFILFMIADHCFNIL